MLHLFSIGQLHAISTILGCDILQEADQHLRLLLDVKQ